MKINPASSTAFMRPGLNLRLAKSKRSDALAWLKRVIFLARAQRARRRALTNLSSMPSFILNDIGITPFDIKQAARSHNAFVRRALRQLLGIPRNSSRSASPVRRAATEGHLWTS